MAGAITDIANVTISLNSVAVSRRGYGTPLFLTKQRFTEEVVTAYSSLQDVGSVFPTTSNTYKAATGFSVTAQQVVASKLVGLMQIYC